MLWVLYAPFVTAGDLTVVGYNGGIVSLRGIVTGQAAAESLWVVYREMETGLQPLARVRIFRVVPEGMLAHVVAASIVENEWLGLSAMPLSRWWALERRGMAPALLRRDTVNNVPRVAPRLPDGWNVRVSLLVARPALHGATRQARAVAAHWGGTLGRVPAVDDWAGTVIFSPAVAIQYAVPRLPALLTLRTGFTHAAVRTRLRGVPGATPGVILDARYAQEFDALSLLMEGAFRRRVTPRLEVVAGGGGGWHRLDQDFTYREVHGAIARSAVGTFDHAAAVWQFHAGAEHRRGALVLGLRAEYLRIRHAGPADIADTAGPGQAPFTSTRMRFDLSGPAALIEIGYMFATDSPRR